MARSAAVSRTPGAFLLLLIGLTSVRTHSLGNTGLTGERQECNNEGGRVIVDKALDSRCVESCTCKHGFVECVPKYCPKINGCHLLMEKKPEECCQKCKGCVYSGMYYDSHTEWTMPGRPCEVLRCEAGIVTKSDLQCYTPCANPLPPAPGKCCATCPICKINGQHVTQNRDVTIPEDPCVKCHCDNGRLTCLKKACPVLHCKPDRQIKKIGECCAQCMGDRTLLQYHGSCIIGSTFVKAGDRLDADRCTSCTCANETAVCRRNTCPVLECSPSQQRTKPGDCCPHCPPVEEIYSTCTYGGKTYQDGESWQLDSCKSCMCHRGEPRCAMQRCQITGDSCPPGFRPIKRPGQCCTECVENDGVCTVFGDPHYKTFDGKFYSFQGSCKYQLASDCAGKAFSVRVTNDAHKTLQSAWTRTVSFRAGDLRVNLGHKLRVKVNGKRIKFPYMDEGRVRIVRKNESVHVTTHVGVSLLWDGHGLLEVSVSSEYKGKLCGLCGNFNSMAEDDLTTRRGLNVSDDDVWKFANSWRVAGKKPCGRPNEHPYKKPHCKPKTGKNPCRYLKEGSHFDNCKSKLNFNNYYEACLQDMCECPNGACHCEALAAYAHECARLGVRVPDWRRDMHCAPGGRGGGAGGGGGGARRSSAALQRPQARKGAHLLRPESTLHLLHEKAPRARKGPPSSNLPIK